MNINLYQIIGEQQVQIIALQAVLAEKESALKESSARPQQVEDSREDRDVEEV